MAVGHQCACSHEQVVRGRGIGRGRHACLQLSPIVAAVPIAAPFAGLLYDPSVAGPMQTLTTPPYDQISASDQERFRRDNPFNVVRLELGGSPSPEGGPDRYAEA